MTVITRFAPSPTGGLHVGNIRAALHNWLWARKNGGQFWLRIDDTDAERSEERHVESIRADLAWLGLGYVGEERQSARTELYAARFEALRAAGHIYPAYETSQELDLKRKIAAGRGLPPIYDRAALKLDDAERERLEADGVRPHWRFKLDYAAPIEWDDLIRGHQKFDAATMSDPVIRRADGSWLYMLISAIDDVEMGVTHVVRGEDHVSNTALQLQMFAAMGATPPRFAHEALLVGSEGKLSKRLGSLGVDAFREAGIEPEAVRALLARIGTSDPVEPLVDMDRAGRDVRFRTLRAGSGQVRRCRTVRAERENRPSTGFRLGRGAPPRRDDARGMGSGAAEPDDRRRCRRVVAGDRGRGDHRARSGGRRFPRRSGAHRRGAGLVRRPLARADRGAEAVQRAQR